MGQVQTAVTEYCSCEHIACVCSIRKNHKPECLFRKAATCAIPIACEHDRDCCPECDACNCGAGVTANDFRAFPRRLVAHAP